MSNTFLKLFLHQERKKPGETVTRQGQNFTVYICTCIRNKSNKSRELNQQDIFYWYYSIELIYIVLISFFNSLCHQKSRPSCSNIRFFARYLKLKGNNT